jgi:hypothetical protein
MDFHRKDVVPGDESADQVRIDRHRDESRLPGAVGPPALPLRKYCTLTGLELKVLNRTSKTSGYSARDDRSGTPVNLNSLPK